MANVLPMHRSPRAQEAPGNAVACVVVVVVCVVVGRVRAGVGRVGGRENTGVIVGGSIVGSTKVVCGRENT